MSKLGAARSRVRVCIAQSCPVPVREDCTGLLHEIDSLMPSLVFEAKDAKGGALRAVKVSVDGSPLAERLDGTALNVDPGEHTFRFEAEGAPHIEKKLVIRESEKDRHEIVVLETVAATPKGAGASELGDDGETCLKRSDCKEGLQCRNEKCTKPVDEEGEYRRRVGFGLGFGGGVASGTLRTVNRVYEGVTPEVIVSSFEFSWYLPGEHAINLYVPLLNNVIGWGLVQGFVWNMDVMFAFNIGSGDFRFVTGPGVGFGLLFGKIFQNGPGVAGGAFRIPGEIAFEYLWGKHTWGVKLAARPWIEIASARYDYGAKGVDTVNNTGGGILVMFVISRFSTTKQGEAP